MCKDFEADDNWRRGKYSEDVKKTVEHQSLGSSSLPPRITQQPMRQALSLVTFPCLHSLVEDIIRGPIFTAPGLFRFKGPGIDGTEYMTLRQQRYTAYLEGSVLAGILCVTIVFVFFET